MLACVSMCVQVSRRVCMSKQKLVPGDFLLFTFLVEAGSVAGQRTRWLSRLSGQKGPEILPLTVL